VFKAGWPVNRAADYEKQIFSTRDGCNGTPSPILKNMVAGLHRRSRVDQIALTDLLGGDQIR
jgi:hypothetical protein